MAYDSRILRSSAWLGWQLDSNWATPWLFILYVLVKPLAGSFMLVCMYWAARAATGGRVDPDYLPFLYVSSACFMLIGGVTSGMSYAVVTDRESHGMLKFIRISPARLQTYLLGRGLSRAGQATVGAVMTITIGLLVFPELRGALARDGIAWHWLLLYILAGTGMVVALGLLLAGAVLNISRYGMFLSDGVAGVLCLLSGAVFPIGVLPGWLRPFSLALPTTYWLEGMRRALLGVPGGQATADGVMASPLTAWGHGHLALALLASTLALGVTAHVFFRWNERRAWLRGKYDDTSGN